MSYSPQSSLCRLNALEKERGKSEKLDSQGSTKLKNTSLSNRSSSQNIENVNNNNTSGANDSVNNNNNNMVHMDTAEDSWGSELVATNTKMSAEEQRASRYLESEGYSTFLYWRDPVADLVDIDLAEQEEELEVVKTELSNLDLESSTDDSGSANETAVEKTEIEDPVPVEEAEKDDQGPEKEVSKEELDNASAESNSAPETEDSVDNKQKIDDNENETTAVVEETQEDKSSEQKESTDSTMELYRPEDVSKAQVSISTFEPGSSRWEAYSNSSLHSSRSSLDSSRSQDPVPPDPALPRGPPETDQSIVPQLLIDHYVSMIDPSRAQTVDNDIARHCAFSLPAVALTLGRTNWPLLKETYESLANDMQWKVRRTLASSIHELGVILGEDVASTDLVPIFNGFIKDLDEVRIGVLKHLADFLKLLGEEERNSYLPRLEEFLKMDNERNWRFRLELTEQLGILVPIFSAEQLTEHLAPIAITLVQDKVAAVRKIATQVLSVMLGSLQSAGELELCRSTVASLVSCLATSSHWTRRQTYAQLVGQLLTALPWQEVSSHLLPHLLNLTEDRVPNVRLQVANVIGHVLSEGNHQNFFHILYC
jgi:serine/threonine-protein phosphatase 4 regulatory subunit 1